MYRARGKDEIENAPELDGDDSTAPACREKMGAYYAAGAIPPEPVENG